MTSAPVNLGLVGIGPLWESRYRPALRKLAAKLHVAAVYDNVASKAEHAAREMNARAVGGVAALADRVDVQALVLLDSGWQGSATLRLLSERRKPILVATPVNAELSELRQWHEQAVAHGVTIMPAFPRRCTPASNRLQELMATQLGRPLRAEIAISPTSLQTLPFATESDFGGQPPPPQDPLLEWADWCHYLFRAAPQQMTRRGDGQGLRLDFSPLIQDGVSTPIRVAELSLWPTAPVADQPLLDEVRLSCERGHARLLGPTTIEWATDEGPQSEELTAERTETEVLLDHFCRRAVGGLIPVPSLEDLMRAQASVACAGRRITDRN